MTLVRSQGGTPVFILPLSERRDGGSFFQAHQKIPWYAKLHLFKYAAYLLKRSGHSSVLEV
jgi:hypothetical protein